MCKIIFVFIETSNEYQVLTKVEPLLAEIVLLTRYKYRTGQFLTSHFKGIYLSTLVMKHSCFASWRVFCVSLTSCSQHFCVFFCIYLKPCQAFMISPHIEMLFLLVVSRQECLEEKCGIGAAFSIILNYLSKFFIVCLCKIFWKKKLNQFYWYIEESIKE